MKSQRQAKILEIISTTNVETQERLLQELEDAGFHSTQATISRDIKQLHLVKQPTGKGGYKYAVSAAKHHLNVTEKLRTIFCESVISLDHAQNIVVIKTMPGLANAACAAVDAMDIKEMVGSLAGDDTAFLLMRSETAAADFVEELKETM